MTTKADSRELPATQLAVVQTAPFVVEVQERPVPVIEEDSDVIVKVLVSALCGSDLHWYRGHHKPPYNFVLGHEFAGHVVKVGKNIKNFKVGDKVVSPFTASLFGSLSLPGGQAEYIRVPLADSTLFEAPDDVSDVNLVIMADIVPTGYFASKSGWDILNDEERKGAIAVVLGCGPVGLCAVTAATKRYTKVYAVDSVPERLELAEKHGATPLSLTDLVALKETLAQLPGGGPDVVLEIVGSPDAFLLAAELARIGGVVVSAGLHTHNIDLPAQQFYNKNLRFQFGRCPARALFPESLEMLREPAVMNLFKDFVQATVSLKEAPKLKNPDLFQESGFINGKHARSASGKTFPVIDPASGQTIGHCPDFTLEELKDAIDVTAKAFDSWRHSTPAARSQVLQKWKQLCLDNQDDLALLITMENGKPLHEALGEVAYANSFLDCGDFIPSPSPVTRTVVIKQPVGPCAFITPWNFPIGMLAKKISPAIAVGCSCVLKPPPETPFSVVAYAALATQAGLPDGLINVVSTMAATKDFGVEMCTSDIIKKVSFTGSTAVGRHLQQLCAGAKMIHKISLELGGNAPFIVFDDADLDLVVEAGIHDRFVSALQERLSAFRVGPGSDPNSTHGPLIHQVQRDKCKAFVDDMVTKGGKIVIGGKIPSNLAQGGAFYDPTIVTGVPRSADSWTGEIFGPIVAITKFETEKEALEMANDCEMGLACYFYTTNVARCWRLSEELSYGMCGINNGMIAAAETPFGGKNNSGLGREGSKYGINDFTEIKLLSWGGISSKPLY
ncbi:succinic semialdehyde dehydrogenase [Pseudohyphozyma bogoriensis]|nr:succinic semialdehyde dehydrogenase [Pseudohyphozyma bogoriensis]